MPPFLITNVCLFNFGSCPSKSSDLGWGTFLNQLKKKLKLVCWNSAIPSGPKMKKALSPEAQIPSVLLGLGWSPLCPVQTPSSYDITQRAWGWDIKLLTLKLLTLKWQIKLLTLKWQINSSSSLMQMLNRRQEPNSERPHKIGAMGWIFSLINTDWNWPLGEGGEPVQHSAACLQLLKRRRIPWSMVSNATERPRKAKMDALPQTCSCQRASMSIINVVSVPNPGLNLTERGWQS